MSQPYGYRSRSARSLNQSVYSGYSVGTAASTGRIVRRTPAPRFHPFIIILAVIFIGMVIVGLVMTIIANWPGYSAIGFNALEIVGPIILGVGGLALISTIAIVVMRNKYQREEWERKVIETQQTRMLHASRHTMEPSTPTPSVGSKGPSKSILKKTESMSTYGRNSNVFEEEDSGVGYTPNVNHSFDRTNDTYDPNRPPQQGYRVDGMPDPSQRYPNGGYYPPQGGYNPQQGGYPPGQGGPNGYREQMSTDSESQVPVPIRVPKNQKKNKMAAGPGHAQYAQETYAMQGAPVPRRGSRDSPLTGIPDIGGMSDRLSYTSDQEIAGSPAPPPVNQHPDPYQLSYGHQRSYDAYDPNQGQAGFQPPPDPGYEEAIAPKPKTKKKRNKSRDLAEDPVTPGYADEPLPTAAVRTETGDLDRNTDVRRSKRTKKKKPVAEGTMEENLPLRGGAEAGTAEGDYAKPKKTKKKKSAAPVQQSSPALNRININAQPGTSVSITPGGPQFHSAKGHNLSQGSVETEI